MEDLWEILDRLPNLEQLRVMLVQEYATPSSAFTSLTKFPRLAGALKAVSTQPCYIRDLATHFGKSLEVVKFSHDMPNDDWELLSQFAALQILRIHSNTSDLARVLPVLSQSVKQVQLFDPCITNTPETLREVVSFLSRSSRPKLIISSRPSTLVASSDPRDVKLWKEYLKGVEFVDWSGQYYPSF